MRKHRSDIRLLASLCAPLILLPLQAAPSMEWLSASGGGGVEYRWNIGLWHVCHTEFRDPAIAGTSRVAEASGVSDYDPATHKGIERNTVQNVNLRIDGPGTPAVPDVGCGPIHDRTHHA